MIHVEDIAYPPYGQCKRVTNGIIDLVITTEFGLRVIRCGFVDEPNQFVEFPRRSASPNQWQIYGGHRFWCAPEDLTLTYEPDNAPVSITQDGDSLIVTQPVGQLTHLQKRLTITLAPDAARVTLAHEVLNHADRPQSFAPWALSVMAQGGTAIMPLPPRGSHGANLLPSNALVLWHYTDMTDPRWTWGKRYVLLKQDPGSQADNPQKVGASHTAWLAYWNAGTLFIKKSPLKGDDHPYPDMGCSVEIFTNDQMLELETLGRLREIPAGADHPDGAHIEEWQLFRDVPEIHTETDIEHHVLPLIG